MTGEYRKLDNEELCSSPSIIRMIKSRMRWAGQVARMGKEERVYVIDRKARGKVTIRKIKT
jgi:hypothetical protein